GKTVDHGILILGDAGLAAANLRQAYVSNSRFRHSQTIYTLSKAQAREAMARSGDRALILEFAQEANIAVSTARQVFLSGLFRQGHLCGASMLRGWTEGAATAPQVKATGTHG